MAGHVQAAQTWKALVARLAVVAFFIAFLPTLGASCFLAFSYFQPHSYTLDIQYWLTDTDGNQEQVTLGPPVAQAQYDEAVKHLKDKDQGKAQSEHLPPMPVGAQAVTAPSGVSINGSIPLKAKVYMPDGTTAEFVGKSDAEITASWNKALHKALFKACTLSIAIAIFVTLSFSYLLQSLYRALLYVVFGSNIDRDQTHSGEPV